MRIKARRSTKIGVVALARKVLCIRYHLLIHQEIYHDDLLGKPRIIRHPTAYSTTSMSLEEMIKTIIKAGFEVRRNEYPGKRLRPLTVLFRAFSRQLSPNHYFNFYEPIVDVESMPN
jgi:hypothetical protein